MMWICRPGQQGKYLDLFVKNDRIYLAWDGYKMDLAPFKERQPFRDIVEKEKGIHNRTSVSNWAAQLFSFCNEMEIGDYVLVPHRSSVAYDLAIITSEYKYSVGDELSHSRAVEFIEKDIPRKIFSQSLKYSLGAYRTLFKVRREEEVADTISKWKMKR